LQEYFSRRLKSENSNIATDEREIQKYRKQSEKMQEEIEQLRTEAKLFQVRRVPYRFVLICAQVHSSHMALLSCMVASRTTDAHDANTPLRSPPSTFSAHIPTTG
jgi:hypothetical protein